MAVAVAVGVMWVTTPGVGDAAQRAAELDRTHGVLGPTTPVPSRFAAALIATENSRFYSDLGIDPVAIVRSGISVMKGRGEMGGATLEQQLVKQLYYSGQSAGVGRKAAQAALAIKLDASYSKRQILQMYAAVAYFGHGYWGLDAASRGYFGRAPGQLSWGQAALLAGLLQAPSAYDPLQHPELARARQRHVLARLVATGQLTVETAAIAASTSPESAGVGAPGIHQPGYLPSG
ncbi:transglycosylase domain-containing protein [Actinopolymorpha pittospori]|uniref:Penicillin-binding protein 1A n=1 Tax=Actinopolymorpha pittospori TaxID=648752 RepID=A0A927MW90_9ACTN|nr:penicillin-binding protein 1A [Actinopolymorpha pittospori]